MVGVEHLRVGNVSILKWTKCTIRGQHINNLRKLCRQCTIREKISKPIVFGDWLRLWEFFLLNLFAYKIYPAFQLQLKLFSKPCYINKRITDKYSRGPTMEPCGILTNLQIIQGFLQISSLTTYKFNTLTYNKCFNNTAHIKYLFKIPKMYIL